MSEAEAKLDRAKAETVMSWFRGEPRAPFSIELSPTMACNVNCLFCRKKDELEEYYSRARDLSDDRWFELITQAIERGTKRLFFRGGGDPGLKRTLFRRLLPLIREKGIYCTILTNGTLFDDATAREFVEGGWAEVIVSLHGGDADTHDRLVDTPGAFARVVRSLELLKRHKARLGREQPWVSFHVVLNRANYRGIDKIVELAAARGVGHVGVFPMHNAPYERHSRDIEMRPEDRRAYRELVPRYQALLLAKGIGADFELAYQNEDAAVEPQAAAPPSPEQIRAAAAALAAESRRSPAAARGSAPSRAASGGPLPPGDLPCYYPWYHAAITPNGFMAPCCYGEGKQSKGDMARVDFNGAWDGHDMAEVRETMTRGGMMPYCEKCPNWYQKDNERVREIIRRELA